VVAGRPSKVPKRGQKAFAPRGTPAEAAALDDARALLRAALQDERRPSTYGASAR